MAILTDEQFREDASRIQTAQGLKKAMKAAGEAVKIGRGDLAGKILRVGGDLLKSITRTADKKGGGGG